MYSLKTIKKNQKIYVQYYLDGKKTFLPTGIRVDNRFWDSKNNKLKKSFCSYSEAKATINQLLAKVEQLVLKRHLKFKAGDCAVMIKHHTHKLLVCKPESEVYLVDDGEQIRQAYTGWGQDEPYIHPDARWYGNGGSFMKLYIDGITGYAERAEYDPVELGFLVLKVRDRKIVSLDPVYIQI